MSQALAECPKRDPSVSTSQVPSPTPTPTTPTQCLSTCRSQHQWEL